jgi:hypothetical protein
MRDIEAKFPLVDAVVLYAGVKLRLNMHGEAANKQKLATRNHIAKARAVKAAVKNELPCLLQFSSSDEHANAA